MTMKAERLARYSTKLVALDAAKKIGLFKQGDYGYRIHSGPFVVDFWPGTGSWRTPTGSVEGRGWNTLMRMLELYDEIEGQP